jgi:hypothetical protein
MRSSEAYQLRRFQPERSSAAMFARSLRLSYDAAVVYDWVNGRPTVMVRAADLPEWSGGGAKPDPAHWAAIRTFKGKPALVLRDPELTTAVPLELGGVMLVTAVYCDGDEAITTHLDTLPTAGWETGRERFVSDGSEYALFDGGLSGAQLADPALRRMIDEQHGGMIPVQLPAGSYDVETLGPFRPDARTELWLTRLVRAAPA